MSTKEMEMVTHNIVEGRAGCQLVVMVINEKPSIITAAMKYRVDPQLTSLWRSLQTYCYL